MKNKLIPSLFTGAILALAVLTPGCTTVTKQVVTNGVTNTVATSQLDPVRTADAIRAITAVAVPFAIEKDPQAAVYFEAAAVLFRAAADAGAYDPVYLQASLDAIPFAQIKTPEAKAGINAAFAIYRAYFGETVSAKILDTSPWAKPVLEALADGIFAALPTPPAK